MNDFLQRRDWKSLTTNLSSGKNRPEPKPAPSNWKKSGKTGYIAHRVMTAGSDYFTTACGVLLDKQYTVDASQATMRCVECRERTGEV